MSTGPALMPPHSQGAERRRGRSGSRWGLRALVVGGLAGAAWLLSGAAAHAADRDPATDVLSTGSSLLGAVVHGGGADAPVADRVLKAAAKPFESGGGRTGSRPGGLLTQPARDLGTATVIHRLVGTVGEVTQVGKDTGTALGGVDRVVRGITAPVRLTGEAVDTGPLAPVTAPVTDLLRDVAEPEPAAPQRDRPEPDAGATTPGSALSDPVVTAPAAGVPGPDVATSEKKSAPVHPVDLVRHKVGKTVTAGAPATVRETPDGDGPAPLRVHLGAANGIPNSGSGTVTDGGPSAAVLPSAVADSTTACRRLSITTDVEVRRHDAEAPTVSPD
ncbi:hypothetical protein [Couchioplanes azureus]|uniref:hypothetical protein n=1 Tax=Couchioplanes caeruleus TaxID=56438 RepID=UPI00167137DF|nr:hypothetical protein [Couchioplanes caeruleus]